MFLVWLLTTKGYRIGYGGRLLWPLSEHFSVVLEYDIPVKFRTLSLKNHDIPVQEVLIGWRKSLIDVIQTSFFLVTALVLLLKGHCRWKLWQGRYIISIWSHVWPSYSPLPEQIYSSFSAIFVFIGWEAIVNMLSLYYLGRQVRKFLIQEVFLSLSFFRNDGQSLCFCI